MGIIDITRASRGLYRLIKTRLEGFLKRRNERGYVAFAPATSVAADGTYNLHLANPADSGITIDTRGILIGTHFEADVDVWDSFSTAPSGGTTEAVENLLLDSSGGTDSGSMEVASDVSFTGDGRHISVVVGGGGAGAQTIGGAADLTNPIIEPGREIVVEVTDTSGNGGRASIAIIYHEEDRKISEQDLDLPNLR